MKICIVTHEFPPNVVSGSGNHAEMLVNSLIKRGHEVTVITTLVNAPEFERKSNLTIHRLRIARSGFLEKIIPNFLDDRLLLSLKLRRFDFDFNKFDILHVIDSKDSYFINRKIKVPIIISVNDYYAYETSWNIFKFPYPCSDLIIRYFYYHLIKLLDKAFLKKAALIQPNTRYLAESVKRICNIPEGRIKVIYRGIDIEKFSKIRSTQKKYFNRFVLFIGRNMERKGGIYIIKAMPIILRDYPKTKLLLVGKCNLVYKKKLWRLVKELNLEKNVEIKDFVDKKEALDLYSKANVFVFPPIIENLARVVYEAMASRTPVVITNVGANAEAVTKDTGILIRSKSHEAIAFAVKKIFSDAELAEKLGKNAYKRIKNYFSEKKMVDSFEKEYRRLKDVSS